MRKHLIHLLYLFSVLYSDTVYRIPIEGTIDLGLPPFINRMLQEAKSMDAEVVVFDINTFGGRVDAATQIKDAILGVDIKTVAFVNRRAISAGAVITLS